MDLGEKLYELRKKKKLSQEDVAEKLDVTRQTVSKWETNQSTPDFDKIVPLCELYEISTDELLTGRQSSAGKMKEIKQDDESIIREKRARAVSISVFLYFIALIWVIVVESIEVINENILIGVFMLIIAFATVHLIYQLMSISNTAELKVKKKYKDLDCIIALLFFMIYMIVSFITSAWSITWLIWIVYSLVIKVLHLILEFKEGENGKK